GLCLPGLAICAVLTTFGRGHAVGLGHATNVSPLSSRARPAASRCADAIVLIADRNGSRSSWRGGLGGRTGRIVR
ncbi:MAG TPA: hypothetical protein VME44_17830, partial [Streptosporangiaceae bacterium]|nr:hypothetical protein [Streptosporangiaceae bacterium]